MLEKKVFTKFIFVMVVSLLLCTSCIYATSTDTLDENAVLKVTDAQYKTIENIMDYINKELKKIDEKISTSRKLEEFDKYPAVRLNIDTPYFGMTSIIDAKLKIRSGVSTADIASGYNIRQVINKKSIKVESFQVSNITIITRDLDINKEMTYTDADMCIFKLLEYLDQVKSANNFLDKQLNSMIFSYLTNEKIEYINKINEKIEAVNDTLNSSLNELSYIYNVYEMDIKNDISKLYDYKNNINNIKSISKNVLSSEENLKDGYISIEKLETEIKIFRFDVNKKFLEAKNNLNIENCLNIINDKMESELKYIQKYIELSMTEIKEENENIVDSKKIVEEYENFIYQDEKKYIENYKVTSKNIFENMKKEYDKSSEMLEKVKKNNEIIEDEINKKEVFDEEAMVNEITSIYINFLNNENVFLSNNSKLNITETKKSDELIINSFEDIKYMYIDLSDILTKISDDFEMNSTISNFRTIQNLKNVVENVITCSANLKNKLN